jgi:hypothetical protein
MGGMMGGPAGNGTLPTVVGNQYGVGNPLQRWVAGASNGTSGATNPAGVATFPNPAQANISPTVTQGQINAGNAGATNSLAASNALLSALGGAGGIGNQSQVYGQGQNLQTALGGLNAPGAQGAAMSGQAGLNAQLGGLGGAGAVGNAIAGQQGLASGLGGAGGIGAQTSAIQNLQNVLAQQQGLQGQLQGVVAGTGPNPAQAMLNQATGQNVANQAALMAGQRGAGSNVGLIARQAAQQGAATQQQAVGQGAALQAQQSLGALGQIGGQQQAMAGTAQGIGGLGAGLTAQQQNALAQQYGQGAGVLGALQTGIGQQFGQGATGVGQQQSQLGINAGIAQNQVGNQLAGMGQNIQGNLANAGQLTQAGGAFNANQVASQGSVNAGNTALNAAAIQGRQGLAGGLLNAGGAGLGALIGGSAAGGSAAAAPTSSAVDWGAPLIAARGGIVPEKMADRGTPDPSAPMTQTPAIAAVPQDPNEPQSAFGKFLKTWGDQSAPDPMGQKGGAAALNRGASSMGTGLLSALSARGGLANAGGHVAARTPGQKARKSGNSYSNDKIPAELSEGEIVIPRSVTMSADPVRDAADFVRKVLAKKGGRAS